MLVILFLLFQITSSCEVQQRSNDQDKPCQFPFIIRNTTYYGCTTALDSEGKLWCSTQTNDQSEHVANQKLWGYCTDPSCPNDNRIKNEALEAENNLQDIEINGRSGSVNCQCIYYRECPWSYQLMQNVANLPRFHLLRNRLITYVKDHICDQATQSVHCCQDQVDQQPSNESTPTITEVPKLTKNNPVSFCDFVNLGKTKSLFPLPNRIWALGNLKKEIVENLVCQLQILLVEKIQNQEKYLIWPCLAMRSLGTFITFVEVRLLINGTF